MIGDAPRGVLGQRAERAAAFIESRMLLDLKKK
jgi:hypothetical protein